MSFQNIIEMRQKRKNLVNQARELVERSGDTLTADQEEQYNKIMDDVDKLKKNIDREERLQAEEHDLQQSLGDPIRQEPGSERSPENEQQRQMKAFNTYLQNGTVGKEIQNLQSTGDADGGYLQPPEQFVSDLLKKVDDQVLIRQWATTFQVQNADSMGVPTLEQDMDDAEWTTELKTGNQGDLGFGKRELHPHPLAKRVLISKTLLRKAVIDAAALVNERMAYKFGVTAEKAYMTGDGANKPLGLFTASNNGISTSRDVANGNTATEIKFDGLIEAKYTLKGQYWNKARWLFHRDAVKQLAKEKDSNGQYIWKESVRVGEPDMVLGLPTYMSEFAPNTFTTGNYVGMLGDFSKYWIADAMSFTVQRLLELYAETNQVGFIGRLESDGMPVLEEAFVRVKLA